jgi:hypothetical protein
MHGGFPWYIEYPMITILWVVDHPGLAIIIAIGLYVLYAMVQILRMGPPQ